jgi:hypothetical protein
LSKSLLPSFATCFVFSSVFNLSGPIDPFLAVVLFQREVCKRVPYHRQPQASYQPQLASWIFRFESDWQLCKPPE